jgi:hypothetical protein
MFDSAKAYEKAAAKAARAGLKAAQVSALSCLVRPLGFIDPDRGIAALDEAVEVSRSLDDPLLLARTQMLAASCRLLYDTGARRTRTCVRPPTRRSAIWATQTRLHYTR